MKNEIDIIRDISAKFSQLNVPFMLTGLLAMNYYSTPRMTRDIDVVVTLEEVNLTPFVNVFSPQYYLAPEAIAEAMLNESMFNLIHNESIIKVDCIIRKSSEYRQLEFERRVRITLEDFQTYIASKEDLILSKLLWAKPSHSEIQLRDVKNLLISGYDVPYVAHWAQQLEVNHLLKECLYG